MDSVLIQALACGCGCCVFVPGVCIFTVSDDYEASQQQSSAEHDWECRGAEKCPCQPGVWERCSSVLYSLPSCSMTRVGLVAEEWGKVALGRAGRAAEQLGLELGLCKSSGSPSFLWSLQGPAGLGRCLARQGQGKEAASPPLQVCQTGKIMGI